MLQIKVNATSANVCVGFDVLGIALDLSNTFTFERSEALGFTGFEFKYCNSNNMVYQAYSYVFNKLKKPIIPVTIDFKGDIPVARGLGSSSSLIVAGVFAANYYLGNPLSKDELFDIACEIEGHPDNVAPAVYGGLIASYKTNGKYKAISYPVSKDLKFITIIPPFPLSTHEARNVLPKTLSYPEIVNNTSRIVNIPLAFNKGDVNLLKELFVDMMHEPYRGKLIKGYSEIKEDLALDEAAFAISGSGSTMLVVTKDLNVLNKLKKYNYEMKVLAPGGGVEVREV